MDVRGRARAWAGLVVVAALCGCGGTPPGDPGDAGVDSGPRTYVAEPFEPTDATRAYCGARDDAAIEARITELLSELTVDEKLSMLSGAAIAIIGRSWLVPGVPRLGIPGLHMLDGPRGLSSFTRVPATAFPVAMMRGATWDPELERRVGAAMAREVRSIGVDVLLAPTMNVLRHPRWGRAQETYSEDTHHMGAMAVAFIEGVQSEGVLASAKHYAVNSIEDTRHDVDVRIDERTLREIYLPHFRRAVVEAHVGSVMSAYNRVNGLYCDLNAHLLTEILKDEWQFAGFVESDWILGTHGDVESIRAGLDIEMPSDLRFRRLRAALASGAIDERELDRSLRRILRAQLCFGLDEWEHDDVDDPSQRLTPEHRALAREVARRGIVLLRNEAAAPPTDAAALPIDAAAVSRIVLAGRNADVENIGDAGSSSVLPDEVVTALEGIRARAGAGVEVTHLTGTSLDAAGEAAVRAADVVVIVTGLTTEDEGEGEIAGGDRESLALGAAEVALIRAIGAIHDRVVVVLEGGAAILTSDFEDEVEALLFAFYPGTRGGEALAEVLFGDAAPSGRLPFSIPRAESDLPAFDNVSPVVTYDYFHGYRHLLNEAVAPAHAFGAGLTYTTFSYASPAVSAGTIPADGAIVATVTITNDGPMRARETVQAYVTAIGSRVPRSRRDLRGFAQVELDPGESREVEITLRAEDLAFWDEAAGAFEVEAIEYELALAHDAIDPGVTARFRVE